MLEVRQLPKVWSWLRVSWDQHNNHVYRLFTWLLNDVAVVLLVAAVLMLLAERKPSETDWDSSATLCRSTARSHKKLKYCADPYMRAMWCNRWPVCTHFSCPGMACPLCIEIYKEKQVQSQVKYQLVDIYLRSQILVYNPRAEIHYINRLKELPYTLAIYKYIVYISTPPRSVPNRKEPYYLKL